MTRSSAASPASRPVKISCRNLWKIYGTPPDRAMRPGQGPAAAEFARQLRAAGRVPALVDASFDVHEGEIFVIMGLSGSGKSTLIRCLTRLIDAEFGEVRLDGEDLLAATPKQLIDIRRHKMGMVFQNFGLMPHLSVLENVAYPLKLQGEAKPAREARARQMISLVGLDGREQALPSQLSGGQQQRVGIARSLAVEPDLWFLDEPFSALDPMIRRQMQDEFLDLQRRLHKTIVFITHDIAEACRLADRIAILRDGRIIQIGTPADLLLRPADDYVAEFTADISPASVIRVGDIARPGQEVAGARTVAGDLPVEALLTDIATGTTDFAVQPAGKYGGGGLTAARVLRILGRHGRQDDETAAG
ncbi:quaternary amine ABC transporter ATP-binding protein [Pseudodonghicola flavimaris]|uniref:ATP-binding cassette domain-containing protein n=1 Tax=Pseudodonghicola flavimaris TaxID=3050036 RepID=A0ABT7F889_9RHOB|nr:ATP-binding cassette domain-containing protein [Pseudodonghicola flavimaris]MDK3020839.1 ATP-binding cassette domain-containing protein [Pseudodonghicola flavimaris]